MEKLIDDGIELVNKYSSGSKLEWLIKTIFEIILTDSTNSDNTIFGITFFNKVNKKELKYVNTIEIEIFLINVLIYFISMRTNNTFGKNTFKNITNKIIIKLLGNCFNILDRQLHNI